jgi:hypothetical protein
VQDVLNGFWVPILGPKHEDAAYIGFPKQHYHFDFRFLKNGGFRYLVNADSPKAHGCVAGDDAFHINTVRLLRRVCVRQMHEWPVTDTRDRPISWMPALEQAFADKRMKCMTCPHRGMPLNGMPVKDGVVVCPGHGLAWNIQTGELVRRTIVQTPGVPAGNE